MGVETYTKTIFEGIRHVDEEDSKYWTARELQEVLGYREWRKLYSVIKKVYNNYSSIAFGQILFSIIIFDLLFDNYHKEPSIHVYKFF